MSRTPKFPDCFDEVIRLNIGSLRRFGYLKANRLKEGSIEWTRGETQKESIRISVDMIEGWVQLDYKIYGKQMNYRVSLVSVPSNLGFGRLWYFICPETGNRCRKLYLIGERFLSRYAYPSTMYSKQIEAKGWRELRGAMEAADACKKFLKTPYARPFYNGQITSRYQRLLNRRDRCSDKFATSDSTLRLRSQDLEIPRSTEK